MMVSNMKTFCLRYYHFSQIKEYSKWISSLRNSLWNEYKQFECIFHYFLINPHTFGTFFIQVHAPFETICYCGFEWWNNCVQCWLPKWFWMVGQLIQKSFQMVVLVWIFPNGSTANTKPCLDTSKWWINGPSKTIWMDLNGSTACYQHCSNGITMCVQNQWAFLKVEFF